jgi:hypothetical protein
MAISAYGTGIYPFIETVLVAHLEMTPITVAQAVRRSCTSCKP